MSCSPAMDTLPLRSVQDLQATQLDKPMYTCTGKDLELERCHTLESDIGIPELRVEAGRDHIFTKVPEPAHAHDIRPGKGDDAEIHRAPILARVARKLWSLLLDIHRLHVARSVGSTLLT